MIRRTYALIVLGVGIVVLILGFLKVLTVGIPFGVSLAFFGLVMTGLSFVPRPQAAADAPAPLSPFERIAGLFYEPSRVFQSLRAHPRWLTALLVIALLNFVYTVAFTRRITPERIADYMAEKMKETGWMPSEEIDKGREQQVAAAKDPVSVAGGAVNQVASVFALMAVIASLMLLGVLAFGGRINFWQALSVALHAALPTIIISKLLSLLLLYLKSPEDIHPIIGANGLVQDNLGVLFSPSEHPVLYTAASFIGVLSFYGLWLMATGLRNGGERVSSTTAWTVAIVLWVLAFCFFVGLSAIFAPFMS